LTESRKKEKRNYLFIKNWENHERRIKRKIGKREGEKTIENHVGWQICLEKKRKNFTMKTSIEVRLGLFGYVHGKPNNRC
jgi:hypothetical protein